MVIIYVITGQAFHGKTTLIHWVSHRFAAFAFIIIRIIRLRKTRTRTNRKSSDANECSTFSGIAVSDRDSSELPSWTIMVRTDDSVPDHIQS
jgi:hypothetical protein